MINKMTVAEYFLIVDHLPRWRLPLDFFDCVDTKSRPRPQCDVQRSQTAHEILFTT